MKSRRLLFPLLLPLVGISTAMAQWPAADQLLDEPSPAPQASDERPFARSGDEEGRANTERRQLPAAAKNHIWFHPLPSAAAPPFGGHHYGSRDVRALFRKNAAWPRAMTQVGVVGMYAGWIVTVSDQELRHTVAFLNTHGMGIEIEAPALQALPTCGSGVEGYVPWGLSLHDFTLTYLHRLKALGAQVLFVKVDEPFFFGSVVPDPRSCHFPVPFVAQAVGEYAQLVKSVYPNAAIGDVEPVAAAAYPIDVVTAITEWHDTYQAVTGAPFPFFIADMDFSDLAWPTRARALEDAARLRGMPFGIIYIGDFQDTSDGEWAAKAVDRFKVYERENGGRPDYVLFQSWEAHPWFCLPESDPSTFTGVIDAYIRATTNGSWP
jgi:hypothetical protein